MSEIRELSVGAPPDFPDTWYEITSDDHFWIEWRFRAFLGQLEALEIPRNSSWRGLDVGCGHGRVRQQLEATTTWTTDGADLNRGALSQNRVRRGETFYYDIHDRRPEFAERYDFAVLFDVLEHVEDTQAFLEAVSYHLRPGAWLFCNVPALNRLRSRFDRTVGHLRRYSRRTLRAEAIAANFQVRDVRYWGFSMLPYLVIRKFMSRRKVSPRRVIERGLPPAPRMNGWILALMKLELAWLRTPLLGTSLLMACVKETSRS